MLEQLEGDYGQIQFHETTASRCFRIEHRLHVMEVCLLGMTLASCGQHLAQSLGAHWFHIPSGLLTFFCAFFPAAGAALAGISNQGEFRKIAQRSASMAERLRQQLQKLKHLQQQLAGESE